MKTLRFYKLAILVLLLINMTTLFFLWKRNKYHRRPDRNQLIEHLSLEGKAKEKVLMLQEDHFQRKDALMDRSRRLHEDLFNYFDNSSKDSHDVHVKIGQIVENQREIEQMTFDYFQKVSTLCNSHQKQELRILIHDVLRRSAGPPKKD